MELIKELRKFKQLIEQDTPTAKELKNFFKFVLIERRQEAERLKGWQWVKVLNQWAHDYQIGNKGKEEIASALRTILLLEPIEE
ncbi:hypothetical protein FCM61_02270 [Mycoplasma bovis]|nr:hypothetical protein [Mycoplasmopsis bovis]MBT1328361.1 hypothetical protein [Mycoplasmopsis bovis]MBT1332878.1 hypothetical protein [Mycoplasmopsis bovis]MBT1393786.1 hypothetical protein [Mycoplasmopsis bovis]